jgi:hypothetical protein
MIETNARNADATSTSRGITLGSDSNALVWPRGPSEEDEDLESVENFNNRRLMRIGPDLPLPFLSEGPRHLLTFGVPTSR